MKYKLLGKSGLRVSELCLGTMTFGTEWGWGADKEESKRIFEHFANAGGNFIDTANRYTDGTSERFVGEFIKQERDHFVVATKFSLHDKLGDLNYAGNHKKNLIRSLHGSLSRLDTDYIDLLWVHAWDFTIAPDELMRSLEEVIRSGKVLHIGISDTPAWIVSRANTIAELRGWNSFVGLQVEYSLLQRTPERDLLPMAKELNIAVTPWAPLAGGALSGKYIQETNESKRLKPESSRLNERSTNIAKEVVRIASLLGVSPSQVALNWTRQKNQTVIPIVGARKVAQIDDSLGSATFEIPSEYIQSLNAISDIDLGFPHDFLQQDAVKTVLFAGEKGKLDL